MFSAAKANHIISLRISVLQHKLDIKEKSNKTVVTLSQVFSWRIFQKTITLNTLSKPPKIEYQPAAMASTSQVTSARSGFCPCALNPP